MNLMLVRRVTPATCICFTLCCTLKQPCCAALTGFNLLRVAAAGFDVRKMATRTTAQEVSDGIGAAAG